ncbi:MAG: DUF456 family protein [Verrucomicrobiae bacterium]|nr:DUF456 family protein [Verrucomicrobiae bacterium]
MDAEQILGLVLALMIMGVAVLGALLPGLPSTPLIVVALLGHKLYFGEDSARWWVLAVLLLLAGLATAMEYLATLLGAKKMGASRWGMFGAMAGLVIGLGAGALIGLVGGLVGLLIGPLLGAVVLESIKGRPKPEAWRAGLGAALGVLAGAVGKVLVSLLIALVFTVEVLWQTLR